MNYRIDRTKKESAYLQLYHALRTDIISGALPYGTKLPSKRLMAEELQISVITVEHSYGLLSDDGYIESRPKSGFYVSFGNAESAREDGPGGERPEQDPGTLGGTDIREASDPPDPIMSATEDFPFTVLSRVMRSVLSDRGKALLVKSPNSGLLSLRETLSQYLRRSRGIQVSPAQIVVGSGAEYLYGLVVELLGRGKKYAVEDPCYDRILQVYRMNDVHPEGLRLGSDGIRSAALRRCTAEVLHVTPWSSYPSGITASASKRHEYVFWAREGDRILVEDDYDSEFASPTRQIETLFSLAPERVIYINTFTKTLAPSMRMGYMVLPAPLVPVFQEKLGFYSCTVPVYDQYVLEEFIREGHLERYINARRRKLRK